MIITPHTLSDGRTIIDVHWFSGGACVGIVVIETEMKERKAYIGVGMGVDELTDATYIVDYGSSIYPHSLSSIIGQLENTSN